MFFRRKKQFYLSRRKRLEEYYSQQRRKKLGIVINAPIASAKNLPIKYTTSLLGRPFRKIHISYTRIFLAVFILAAVTYLLFFSSIFKVNRIVVVNNKILIEGDMVKFLEERNIKDKNIFLLNSRQVAEVLRQYYGRIEEVRVYKVLPAKLKIKIKEMPPTLIWKVGEEKYLLDSNGFIISRAEDNLDMPIVLDQATVPVKIGDRIVTQNFIEFVNTIDESLRKRFGLGVVGYTVAQTTFELRVHINSGFYILFDTTADAVEQLDKLAKVYQAGEIIHEYVILSVSGKVIVK